MPLLSRHRFDIADKKDVYNHLHTRVQRNQIVLLFFPPHPFDEPVVRLL